MSFTKVVSLLALVSALPSLADAQGGAPPAPAKPDSPEVLALIEKARQAGGPTWAATTHFFCEAPRANSNNDPVIEPTKIFDNVYAIGNSGTTAYVVQTSDGLLMIDVLNAPQVETQLLPGFKKLGLDPAQVKVILGSHGHADHMGAASYMQEHFGSRIYLSEPDWTLIETPPTGRGGGVPQAWPKRDQILREGQAVVLGDLKVMPVAVPGHTPGSMGFIFPVKDNGRTYTAALFGGTALNPGFISTEALGTYVASIAHFKDATAKAKADVAIHNHPLMDPIQTRLTALAARLQGGPNPFVVGQENYEKFLDVMSLCAQANIARRK